MRTSFVEIKWKKETSMNNRLLELMQQVEFEALTCPELNSGGVRNYGVLSGKPDIQRWPSPEYAPDCTIFPEVEETRIKWKCERLQQLLVADYRSGLLETSEIFA